TTWKYATGTPAMPQILTCPNPKCKKPVQVPDGSSGKQLKCPMCQKMFVVPAMAGAAAGGRGGTGGSHAGGPPSSMEFQLPNIPPAGGGGAVGGKCPACSAPMLASAICCMECGWTQPDADDAAGESENVIVCNNPMCMVANPPSERNCVRCGN